MVWNHVIATNHLADKFQVVRYKAVFLKLNLILRLIVAAAAAAVVVVGLTTNVFWLPSRHIHTTCTRVCCFGFAYSPR